MVVYGKGNLNEILECFTILDIAVEATQFWILPIYKVKIKYYK